MTKTSEAHRGGGSSLPGTSTVSVWCLDQQKRSLLDSVSLQHPVTPEDCPPRVSALQFSHMTLSHFSSLAFKQNVGYVCLLNREMKASHLGAGVPAPAVCEEHSDCVSCSLWLCDGCSAVHYEALDDSPDDMYLDWFQGQPIWRSWACWPCVC